MKKDELTGFISKHSVFLDSYNIQKGERNVYVNV